MAGLDLGAMAPPGRPYVVGNAVTSVDGRAALEGSSLPLSGAADRSMFFALRSAVDAVLVGTRTLAREPYGRLAGRPERREQRLARGLAADPLALVLARSGAVPDVPLLRDGAGAGADRVLVLTGPDAEPARALAHVRSACDVRSVLCEGGPTLFAGLLADGLLDELWVTVAPVLVGGLDPLTLLAPTTAGAAPVALELLWALEGDGALLLRYACRPGAG